MSITLRRFGMGLASVAVAGLVAFGVANTASADKHKDKDAKVAKVGYKAPDFTLTDIDGKSHTLSDYTKAGKIVVLEWFNPDCPFVVKHHKTFTTMSDLANKYADKDVVWIAINSGAPGKQGHGLDRNRSARDEFAFTYPLLIDEDNKVAHKYEAKVTPHMFIIDTAGVLRYNGAIDNNRSAATLGDVNYVKQALDQVLAGETVTETETRPYGCTVKYKD
jgi:peroxiredoxin